MQLPVEILIFRDRFSPAAVARSLPRQLWLKFELQLSSKSKNLTSTSPAQQKHLENHYLTVPNDERACNRSCSRASSATPRT